MIMFITFYPELTGDHFILEAFSLFFKSLPALTLFILELFAARFLHFQKKHFENLPACSPSEMFSLLRAFQRLAHFVRRSGG